MYLSPARRIGGCDSCRHVAAACGVVFDDGATFDVCSRCVPGSARRAAVTAFRLPALPVRVSRRR